MKAMILDLLSERPAIGGLIAGGGSLGAITIQGAFGIISGLIGIGVGSVTLLVLLKNNGGLKGIWNMIRNITDGGSKP